ncbi:NAD(+) diphosphatase [Microbacterium koreense]|uniref:NAD(+) diphosphatase n=1 Tax=Microbacterium koreense TaxID=323761 RepID=A0ABW2ZRK2_9MICO
MTVSDASGGGGATLDRAGGERERDGLLDTVLADDTTRALIVAGDTAPLRTPDALEWVAVADAPADARWAFLGRDVDGAALVVGAVAAGGKPFAAPAGWAPLRVAGAALNAADADALVTAVSVGRWLRDADHCPACGGPADLHQAGWARRCPRCGREHFPRTDPAVIVAIRSATDPDRLLLGSNAMWGASRYSCFAGFVEAGESLESAVLREVAEESGIEVTDIRYRGSQAWPYPRSLMVGFWATARQDDAARPDGEEIVSVRWFSRAEIAAALRGEGDVLLPGPTSIAHRLIRDWCEGKP